MLVIIRPHGSERGTAVICPLLTCSVPLLSSKYQARQQVAHLKTTSSSFLIRRVAQFTDDRLRYHNNASTLISDSPLRCKGAIMIQALRGLVVSALTSEKRARRIVSGHRSNDSKKGTWLISLRPTYSISWETPRRSRGLWHTSHPDEGLPGRLQWQHANSGLKARSVCIKWIPNKNLTAAFSCLQPTVTDNRNYVRYTFLKMTHLTKLTHVTKPCCEVTQTPKILSRKLCACYRAACIFKLNLSSSCSSSQQLKKKKKAQKSWRHLSAFPLQETCPLLQFEPDLKTFIKELK